VRKIAIAAVAVLIAVAAATTYRLTQGSSGGQLSAADARAAMRAEKLQDIGWRSTAGEKGPLGSECRARVHGATRTTSDGVYRVTMWVCDSAATARGIANGFPASMPGLSDVSRGVGRLPGIDVSAQDNVLVWVAASHPSLAYEAAEHLRDLLGGSAGSAS